jgi:hypothetical protein
MHIQKKLRRLFLTLLAGALLIVLGAHFASNYAEEKTRQILMTIPLEVSSVDVNVITRTIELIGVDWTQANDSLPQFPHHMSVNKVRLEGIKVYQLVANRKLHIHKILLDGGEFQFNKNLKNTQSNPDEKKLQLQGISVDRVILKDMFTKISADSATQYEGLVNLSLEGIAVKDLEHLRKHSSYKVESFQALITGITIRGKKEMYATTIARVYANSVDGKIEMDSILLVPKYSKYRFSRKIGRQTDRMNVLLPRIALHDVAFPQLKDSLFRVGLIEIKSPEVYIYKDKRLPFIKEKNTPLPIAMIRDFNIGIAIDSIKVIDGKITYEEFPEKGFHTGKLTFEKLNATLDHLSNRDHYPDLKQATLKATSYLMGKGLINAEFSLPYGKAQVYNAKGSLTNLSLYRLNPILENLAFVSVTSGKLNKLSFNFDYTDLKATGAVLINYEDLKINTLTKEEDPEKNEIKSFVVNTILKKNKDEKVDKEKRSGTIDFERDKRRAIFHYWWRSVLTGIKSTAMETPRKKEKDKEKEKEKERKGKGDDN